jgi:hypothetical protein
VLDFVGIAAIPQRLVLLEAAQAAFLLHLDKVVIPLHVGLGIGIAMAGKLIARCPSRRYCTVGSCDGQSRAWLACRGLADWCRVGGILLCI